MEVRLRFEATEETEDAEVIRTNGGQVELWTGKVGVAGMSESEEYEDRDCFGEEKLEEETEVRCGGQPEERLMIEVREGNIRFAGADTFRAVRAAGRRLWTSNRLPLRYWA